MVIQTEGLGTREINQAIRTADGPVTLKGCLGQRFLCAGMSGVQVTVEGTPGNALGAYLNGAEITVRGNAQDAVGDTMNGGRITVCGSIGDAAGYAMRGGRIFVKEDAGYRAGIHMKAYGEKIPRMVIGGCAGSFLGEYQAGGIILVLGLGANGRKIVGNFPCTGMHGGKMYLRSDGTGLRFPAQVRTAPADAEALNEIRECVDEYCSLFGGDPEEIMHSPFTAVTPEGNNPYRQLYAAN